MKHLLFILLFTGFVSCTDKSTNNSNTHPTNRAYCVIDSVEYHGVGQDHSLQTTPYWKVHVKDSSFWARISFPREVGDTLIILYNRR
jgi:hypothetical protein